MNKLNESLQVVQGIAPQDIGTADVTSSYLPMSGARQILATLTTASLTAGKIATIELLQATSSAGAGAKALKTAVSGTAPVGNGAVTVSVGAMDDEFDTNNGYVYYAVKVTCDENGKLGAVTVARGDLRYSL